MNVPNKMMPMEMVWRGAIQMFLLNVAVVILLLIPAAYFLMARFTETLPVYLLLLPLLLMGAVVLAMFFLYRKINKFSVKGNIVLIFITICIQSSVLNWRIH